MIPLCNGMCLRNAVSSSEDRSLDNGQVNSPWSIATQNEWVKSTIVFFLCCCLPGALLYSCCTSFLQTGYKPTDASSNHLSRAEPTFYPSCSPTVTLQWIMLHYLQNCYQAYLDHPPHRRCIVIRDTGSASLDSPVRHDSTKFQKYLDCCTAFLHGQNHATMGTWGQTTAFWLVIFLSYLP